MNIDDFLPKAYTAKPKQAPITYTAPSNIALIKYWGKHGVQLPKNPSVSFTLNNCKTTTTLSFEKLEKPLEEGFDFEIHMEGKPKPGFKPKIEQFFDRVVKYLPFLRDYRFTIDTENSFPHSSGIASSASGLGALAMCLVDMESQMAVGVSANAFTRKASFIARLGSGSGCRSIEGPMVVWGENATIEGSSDLFGVVYPYTIHEVFHDYHDAILIIDRGEKQVSSTVGHNLMNNHPFAADRFEQGYANMKTMKDILEEGDLDSFIHLVEREALTLHAMMMTSSPYFILMKPDTLKVVNKVWQYRRDTQVPLCFTLDAGANVHLLYPKQYAEVVTDFIEKELVSFCQNGQFILDHAGSGAKKL